MGCHRPNFDQSHTGNFNSDPQLKGLVIIITTIKYSRKYINAHAFHTFNRKTKHKLMIS